MPQWWALVDLPVPHWLQRKASPHEVAIDIKGGLICGNQARATLSGPGLPVESEWRRLPEILANPKRFIRYPHRQTGLCGFHIRGRGISFPVEFDVRVNRSDRTNWSFRFPAIRQNHWMSWCVEFSAVESLMGGDSSSIPRHASRHNGGCWIFHACPQRCPNPTENSTTWRANQPIDIDDREIRDGLKGSKINWAPDSILPGHRRSSAQQHPPPFRDPDRARQLALRPAITLLRKSARRKQRQDSDAGGPLRGLLNYDASATRWVGDPAAWYHDPSIREATSRPSRSGAADRRYRDDSGRAGRLVCCRNDGFSGFSGAFVLPWFGGESRRFMCFAADLSRFLTFDRSSSSRIFSGATPPLRSIIARTSLPTALAV